MSGGSAIYTIAFAYNADNLVTSASDPDSSYANTLDNLGRVTNLDNSGTPNMPHVVLASQYDAMNDRTQLTATVAGTADFLNSYSYDADQRLLSATQEGQTGRLPRLAAYVPVEPGSFRCSSQVCPSTRPPFHNHSDDGSVLAHRLG